MINKNDAQERMIVLLEKALVFQLYALGISQPRIARSVGRQLVWVNSLLKGMPKIEKQKTK
jgi:hypothetical protein